MKTLYVYLQLNEGKTNVFVSDSDSASVGITAGRSQICPLVSDGVKVAYNKFISGVVVGVTNTHGCLMLIGPISEGVVTVSLHPMFLITIDRKNSFWLENGGRFNTVLDLERYLSAFTGAENFEWSPVSESNMNRVVQNLSCLDLIMPKIVVVLEDGNPVKVEIGGVAIGSIRVQVLNIQHKDDQSDDLEREGVLTYWNGTTYDYVIDCTPEVEFFETAELVAKYI
jgi:hypothetical protein